MPEDSVPSPSAPKYREFNARAAVKVSGPAICLLIVGGINLAVGLFNVVRLLAMPPPEVPPDLQSNQFYVWFVQFLSGPFGLVLNLAMIVNGLFILWGGVRMKNLRNYRVAVAAASMAMVPCVSVYCLGIPVGMWSILVLNDPEVKSAY